MKAKIKITLFVLVLSLASAPVIAGGIKVGIGAGATENGSTVYIPIQVPLNGNFILLEPSLSYSKNADGLYGIINGNIRESEYGVGLFWGRPVTKNIDFLMGGRVAYVAYEKTHTIDLDGFSIAPTVGVEYNVNSHITIGGFVDYRYTRIEGTEPSYPVPSVETKEEEFKANTNLFVKFYF